MPLKHFTGFVPFVFVWLWSTGFVGARFGLPFIEPFFMLTIRFSIAIPCFLGLIWLLGKHWLSLKQAGMQMLVGALLHGLYLGGVFYAISIGTPAGIAAIIVGLQPILTTAMNRIFFGETIHRIQFYGLGLGFLGLLAVILGSAEITENRAGWVGLWSCLLSLAGISVSTIIQKRYAGQTPLVAGAMWQYVGAIVFVAGISMMSEHHEVVFSWQLAGALAWLIFALSLGAVLLLMYMIREGEVARVSSYFYLVPPVAAIQTWWLFDERLSLLSILGCVVVMCGVALVLRAPKEPGQSSGSVS